LDDANSEEKVAVIARIFSEQGEKLFGNFSVHKAGRSRIHRKV